MKRRIIATLTEIQNTLPRQQVMGLQLICIACSFITVLLLCLPTTSDGNLTTFAAGVASGIMIAGTLALTHNR